MIEKIEKGSRKIIWARCRDLKVLWANAQQPYDEKHAKRIAADFDPDMLDPIKVTKPNASGVRHIIDGQHRKAAIETLFGLDEMCPCEEVSDAEESRAAELFVAINTNRKRPSPLSVFRVKVTAGAEVEVAVDRIVRKLGYHVANNHSDHNILAAAALVSIYRQHGGTVLNDTLQIIQATWGKDPNAVTAPIVRGYAALLNEHGTKINHQRLKECIEKRFTPGRLVGAAKTAREISGGSLTAAVKEVLFSYYNRNLKTGQLKAAA